MPGGSDGQIGFKTETTVGTAVTNGQVNTTFGDLFKHILGTTTGVGPPYTHTFVPSDESEKE